MCPQTHYTRLKFVADANSQWVVGYHLYIDKSTGVSYSATLVRHTLVKSRSRKETFHARVSGPDTFITQRPLDPHLVRVPIYNPFAQRIQIYETNKEPHTYTTFVKYTRVGVASKDMLAPKGSSLEQALFAFKKFFQVKTGVEWKDRFDDSKLLLNPEAGSNGGESSIQAPEGGWFRYERSGGLMGALSNDAESATGQDSREDGFSEAETKDAGENEGDNTARSMV